MVCDFIVGISWGECVFFDLELRIFFGCDKGRIVDWGICFVVIFRSFWEIFCLFYVLKVLFIV